MPADIRFNRELEFEYGVLETVAPSIRRVTARNPSPFTFHGTGTYVVGHGRVAVIDPGPALEAHIEALVRGLRGETVTHVLVTHTHRDHSPGCALLRRFTPAPTYGFGPHGSGRAPATEDETVVVEEGADSSSRPTWRCATETSSSATGSASSASTPPAIPPTTCATGCARTAPCSAATT